MFLKDFLVEWGQSVWTDTRREPWVPRAILGYFDTLGYFDNHGLQRFYAMSRVSLMKQELQFNLTLHYSPKILKQMAGLPGERIKYK